MVQITRRTDAAGVVQYLLAPDTASNRAILEALRSWSRTASLATFAAERHGFGNSDGGFGVNYPGDLDADEREAAALEDGLVMVYGFFGPPDGYELTVPESQYLECLAAFLDANALGADAACVRALRPGGTG